MKTKYIISIFILFINSLHVQSSNPVAIHFPIEKNLVSTGIAVPDIIMRKTVDVIVSGNNLIFARTFTEPFFLIFSLPDCKYIGGFGRKGKGPNEFELPDARTARSMTNGFKLFDAHKGLIYIDFSEYSTTKRFYSRQIKLPGELYTLNDPIQLNDNIVIGMPYVMKSDKMYVKFNMNSKEIAYFGNYPKFYPGQLKELIWSAFYRHSVIKPGGLGFASFFDEIKMLRIYDSNLTLQHEVIMQVPDLFEGKKFKENPMVYYQSAKATDKYIFALCLNTRLNNSDETLPDIEIWDWNGNPVARLKLDHFIHAFDVTPDGKGIYGMDHEISDKLFYYDLEAAF